VIKLIECKPMNARITEAQCRRNQAKAKKFNENQVEYFMPSRLTKKQFTHAFRRYQWGICEKGAIFQPIDSACLYCDQKKIIYRCFYFGTVYGDHKEVK
jgi:hypothetical protein